MTIYTVTASVTYVFDTDDQPYITSAEDAENDVRELIASGDMTSGEFTYTVVEGEDNTFGATPSTSDASLGVGHIWTNVRCPAYTSGVGTDCDCNETHGEG